MIYKLLSSCYQSEVKITILSVFYVGGMYLKKSEPISLTGSAGGIPPDPPFRPPRLEAEAKRQTAKEPEKMSARTLFWPEAGFSSFFV
ncbi:MAG TPA: hypothetical protein PLF70_02640 [Candidatus Portnoybacteria bacterium]|nr:hypothetical protein [Candidatus Portnoybacteria bacterium]